MNIISCKGCGVLFDKDVIDWPIDDGDCIDHKKSIWTGSDFSVFILCLVCKEPIIKDNP